MKKVATITILLPLLSGCDPMPGLVEGCGQFTGPPRQYILSKHQVELPATITLTYLPGAIDQCNKSFPTARKDIVIRQKDSTHILNRLTLNDASLSADWTLSANTLGLSSGTHTLQLEIFVQWILPQRPDWELSFPALPKTSQDASIVVSIIP